MNERTRAEKITLLRLSKVDQIHENICCDDFGRHDILCSFQLSGVFLKNGPTPASFLFIFGILKNKQYKFTANQCEK